MNPSLSYFRPAEHQVRTLKTDICIYGGVSGGVIAAIEGAKRGYRVVLLEPSNHLGGLSASGLGNTDIGSKLSIGGLSREFYRRVGARYGVEEEWCFEPHIAEEVFESWLAETNVQVFKRQFIEAVRKENGRLVALRTLSGLTVEADIFIDAGYEGDLMALAGVSYAVGRESNAKYGESYNGAQIRDLHQFESPVDPYLIPGDPASGLLPGIEPGDDFVSGAGDHRLQAYNFRMCLTRRDDIRLPFPKPDGYDDKQYLLLKRFLATGWNDYFETFMRIRNGKVDANNHGAVSTDFIGMNYGYPEAGYAGREKIFQDHVRYQQGLMWCLTNDPGIPAPVREPMREWGLCRDEFTDCGGWSHALYIRESRRMVSDYVMTEHHCLGTAGVPDAIGMGAYGMDSHNCRRIVRNGSVWNEGDVQITKLTPYSISYRSIVPRKSECENLFVTFCLSASHISFGSIRMEPVLMLLSQSAVIAADIALKEGRAVQDVPYESLEPELLEAKQVLRLQPEPKKEARLEPSVA
jgi:hypothetical protein